MLQGIGLEIPDAPVRPVLGHGLPHPETGEVRVRVIHNHRAPDMGVHPDSDRDVHTEDRDPSDLRDLHSVTPQRAVGDLGLVDILRPDHPGPQALLLVGEEHPELLRTQDQALPAVLYHTQALQEDRSITDGVLISLQDLSVQLLQLPLVAHALPTNKEFTP